MVDSPVLKAIAILRRLAEHDMPVGVQQLATELNLNVSTVYRLLQLLASDGMAAYDPQARVYSVGTECIRLASRVLGSGSLIGRMRPLVSALAARVEETCALSLYDPDTLSKIVAVVERGPHLLDYNYEVGTRDGIHAGASGKAILAFLPDADIDRVLKSLLPRLTETTVVDPTELRRQIRQIRKRGYATSRGERIPESGFGVAAPVFGLQRQVIGSVVVTIPPFRWRSERLATIGKELIDCARDLSGLSDPILAAAAGGRA
jgi:DNA-binding IclR family transcriptional regulator